MASFFQKVISTQCTGANDPKCQKFVNKERMPPFRKRCPDCGSDTKEIVQADHVKVIAAVALAVLLSGGGAFAASQGLRSSVMNLLRPGHGDSSNDNGDSDRRRPDDHTSESRSPIALSWTMETEHDGTKRRLSEGEDFSRESPHVFRTRDAFHEGDRLRLTATTKPAKTIYVFYMNGSEARKMAVDDGGSVSVPDDSHEWLKLDANPGTEEFIMVAANQRQRKLDDLADDNLGPEALTKQFHDLLGRSDVALTRVQVRHE